MPPLSTRDTPGISSQPHPEGEPFINVEQCLCIIPVYKYMNTYQVPGKSTWYQVPRHLVCTNTLLILLYVEVNTAWYTSLCS